MQIISKQMIHLAFSRQRRAIMSNTNPRNVNKMRHILTEFSEEVTNSSFKLVIESFSLQASYQKAIPVMGYKHLDIVTNTCAKTARVYSKNMIFFIYLLYSMDGFLDKVSTNIFFIVLKVSLIVIIGAYFVFALPPQHDLSFSSI